MAEREDGEDELADRLGAGLHPIGRVLRATYHADNHDSLGQDLTGLMLQLSRDDLPTSSASGSPSRVQATPRTHWLERLFGRWRRA